MSAETALVTGGAGLIGSHLVDQLLHSGWRVRILDNLEPVTHAESAPHLNPDAEFIRGDVREPTTVRRALAGVDVVFHQAAYGGYMPEVAKFIDVNVVGTARILEAIRADGLSVRKVVLASSQAVYSEGAVNCDQHGLQFPPARALNLLEMGEFDVPCPLCGGIAQPALTPESAAAGGENVYAVSKYAEERLSLAWGLQSGIPVVPLRYSCTYGPRQSLSNPYTGVIAIFVTRILNGLPPVVFEDGRQTRDLGFVADVARANLLAAVTDTWDGVPVNIGSGVATSILELASLLCAELDPSLQPVLSGEFRVGEIRALTPDTSRAEAANHFPRVGLREGLRAYLDWIRAQDPIAECFSSAAARLRDTGMLRRTAAATAPRRSSTIG
ncbi:MAG: NAD-dependent epimerase/dehydratase family protein [Candidatus Dormibacteraeota bacterium]|nr:NAD-dependent epimerase/dehydratase family protein [Candidatus Dormibacteraeota bacterium]